MDVDFVSLEAFKTLLDRVTTGKPEQLAADVPGRPVLISPMARLRQTIVEMWKLQLEKLPFVMEKLRCLGVEWMKPF